LWSNAYLLYLVAGEASAPNAGLTVSPAFP
jgi:hypothetical protein